MKPPLLEDIGESFRRASLIALALAVQPWLASGAEEPADGRDDGREVRFERDVRPLLQRYCWDCHGGDQRKGGLRLDQRAALLEGGDSGKPALVPGSVDESFLLQRLAASAPGERMPPKGKRPGPTEIETLRRWIAQGARWGDLGEEAAPGRGVRHWAFEPPRTPPLPVVSDPFWLRNHVDSFVLARLEAEGLTPAPEADRSTLLRRVTLDLIGLPPTPAEVTAFAGDDEPGAYERVVERLLASPHYGERWARLWLDAARYADTNGYEKDLPRSIWPYRDWVIRALNGDQAFDEFTIEQIAGDLLPGATQEQRIATGFHRNTMINQEGGIDVAEDRFKAVVDRVKTTSTVFLGLTMSCAQCHTHKYDPLTQREYYRFFAFFNNADEIDMEVATPALVERREEIAREIRVLEEDLERRWRERGGGDEKLAAWERDVASRAVRWHAVETLEVTSEKGATLRRLDDGSILVSGDLPNNDTYSVNFRADLPAISALRIEALPHPGLPDNGPGRALIFSRGDFFLSEARLERLEGQTVTPLSLASPTVSYAAKGRSAAATLDGKLDTGWAVKGRVGEAHSVVFELPPGAAVRAGDALRLTLVQQHIHQLTIGRFRLSVTAASRPVVSSGVPADLEAALVVSPEKRGAAARAALKRYYLERVATELDEERKELARLRKEHRDAADTTMVFAERGAPRTTYIHHRGEFLQPREPVSPGVPEVLHALPGEPSLDRLTLARWLVSPENPLVARVTMNRYWAALFGRGIVGTVDDFGVQGEKPTHPKLLDWLAREFVRRDWNIKEMHRLLVTSATYRQSAVVSPGLLARDPGNELLARAGRYRLSAEQIRDLALSSSGLITRHIGGPSVFLPQPEDVKPLAWGNNEVPSTQGAARYRRGLYGYLKRTAPYPAFMTFDGTSREEVCVRRTRTNTPLQALTLLNDVVFIESACALAVRALREAEESPADRARYLFLLVLGREPRTTELGNVLGYYRRQLERFRSGEARPEDLLEPATSGDLPGVARDELAAWTLVSRALLNVDETITRG